MTILYCQVIDQNECGKYVYSKSTSDGFVVICLYVNDMLILGKAIKKMLTTHFDMKEMCIIDLILGIKLCKITSGSSIILISPY